MGIYSNAMPAGLISFCSSDPLKEEGLSYQRSVRLELSLGEKGEANERTRHHPAGERSQRNTPQSCCLIMEPCDATQFYNRRKVRQGDGGGILSAAPLAPIRHWPTPSPGTPKFWRSARST